MTDPDHPSVTIRAALVTDIPALAEFIEPFVADGRLLPRTTRELHELLPHGFVAETEGQIVGFAALEIYSRKLAEIRSLAVAHSLQGKGVGRDLVSQCVQRAREKSVLEVMAITSTDEFFVNCGFDFTLPGERKALFIQTLGE
jgi:amino-acid N-acetyltransferase